MRTPDNSLSEIARLLNERLAVVGLLAESLEESRLALVRKDAEAIARGAAHQAELCRQWSALEEQLRAEAARRREVRAAGGWPGLAGEGAEAEQWARLKAEWDALQARIRYLTRVHWSLLRHMQRSLGILKRVIESCAVTYAPASGMAGAGARSQAGE